MPVHHMISLGPKNNWGGRWYYGRVITEETEAQRSQMTCLRSQTRDVEWDSSSDSKASKLGRKGPFSWSSTWTSPTHGLGECKTVGLWLHRCNCHPRARLLQARQHLRANWGEGLFLRWVQHCTGMPGSAGGVRVDSVSFRLLTSLCALHSLHNALECPAQTLLFPLYVT